MAISILLLIVGLVFIIKGGDWFVEAASWVAEKTGIPKLVVGATVVSLATTLPEILVSVISAAQGQVEMAIGNAVGSVTANLGLIMGVGIVCMPSKDKIQMRNYRMKFLLLLLAAGLTVAGGLMGGVNLVMAVILISLVVVFLIDNVGIALSGKKSKAAKKNTKKVKSSGREVALKIGEFVLGAVGIVAGAELLVSSGTDIATALGVSERIIAVTLVAVGTSLPELVTMITAIIKKERALGFGNILGANIIDLALIMPLCAIISGQVLPISNSSAMIDLPACMAVAVIAIVPTVFTKKFQRWQGFAMLATYAVYMVLTCTVTL